MDAPASRPHRSASRSSDRGTETGRLRPPDAGDDPEPLATGNAPPTTADGAPVDRD